MTECAFHPEKHATAELGVDDPIVGDRIQIPICDSCADAYDKVQAQYLREEHE